MPLTGKTVLIVEDNDKTNKMLNFLFMSKGASVLSSFNGKEALTILEKTRPDVIILDLMMPEMDGFEFCEHFQSVENHEEIPIIILSVLPEKKHIDQLKPLGIEFYFEKPFAPEEIMKRVLEVTLQNGNSE